MLEPGALHCKSLGYEVLRGQTRYGDTSLCLLPDGQVVDVYDFYAGRVGLEWSYCAREGYEARHVEGNALCKECTACVLPDGSEQTVASLMGLDFRETHCGDGSCGITEDFASCARDCPSGSADEYCDAVADGRCDPDCVEQGQADADCPRVFVDIKAGSCPNPFNTRSRGVLPVAILGTPKLDVTRINPSSIKLKRPDCLGCRGVPAIRWNYDDVTTPYAGNETCGCAASGPDGYPDLNLKFDRQEVAERLKLDREAGNSIVITVDGDVHEPYDVSPLKGSDCIEILGGVRSR